MSLATVAISNLLEIRILNFLSKKFVKLKGDLHCLVNTFSRIFFAFPEILRSRLKLAVPPGSCRHKLSQGVYYMVQAFFKPSIIRFISKTPFILTSKMSSYPTFWSYYKTTAPSASKIRRENARLIITHVLTNFFYSLTFFSLL